MTIISALAPGAYMGRPTHFRLPRNASRAGPWPALLASLRRLEAAVVFRFLLNGRADRRELRVGLLPEERDGGDADHRDQGDEEGVLDEARAPLGPTEARPKVGGALLLPVADQVHVCLLSTV